MSRQFNKPWKHIYGVDRRYTARVNRLAERVSNEDAIDNALVAAARERRGQVSSYPLLDPAGPVMSSGLSMAQPDPTDPETHDEGEPA